MKVILICGGFKLPDRNASAVRALGLARLVQQLGYKVYVIGKLPANNDIKLVWYIDNLPEIECVNILKPTENYSGPSYVVSAAPVAEFISRIDNRSIHAIITYNYPARGAYQINKLCKRLGIASVYDCTEWYGWEGKNFFRNVTRLLGVQVKMRLLARQAGNMIVASSFLEHFFSNQKVLKLPFVVDPNEPRWERGPIPSNQLPTFTYSGSPGLGMHKDRLPTMVKAFNVLKAEGHHFILNIVGLTKKEYLAEVPDQKKVLRELAENIRFFGRVPHNESIDLLRSSDFAVFFRKSNRVANAGFSTKYVEAATLGIPIISNSTSDIAEYLNSGFNGFLASEFSSSAITEVLHSAIAMSLEQRREMHMRCRSLQPFHYHHWLTRTDIFLKNLVVRS